MKKQRKLNLRKLSVAKLDEILSVKGGTDTEDTDSDDTNPSGPKTRTITKITQVPEECTIISQIVGGCD